MQIKISTKKANEIYESYMDYQESNETWKNSSFDKKYEEIQMFNDLKAMADVAQSTNFEYVIVNNQEFNSMKRFL